MVIHILNVNFPWCAVNRGEIAIEKLFALSALGENRWRPLLELVFRDSLASSRKNKYIASSALELWHAVKVAAAMHKVIAKPHKFPCHNSVNGRRENLMVMLL